MWMGGGRGHGLSKSIAQTVLCCASLCYAVLTGSLRYLWVRERECHEQSISVLMVDRGGHYFSLLS